MGTKNNERNLSNQKDSLLQGGGYQSLFLDPLISKSAINTGLFFDPFADSQIEK